MLCITSFYNSKISILNGSASLFGENDFNSREADQSFVTIKHLKTVVKQLETIVKYLKSIIKYFETSTLQLSSISRPIGNKFFYPITHIVNADASALISTSASTKVAISEPRFGIHPNSQRSET